MDLTAILTAFGLAAAAGTRGAIPLLALGLFSHTPWFHLAPRLAFLGRPEVIATIGVFLVLETWFDAHPEWGRLSDHAAWLWKLLAGFVAFAAANGSVDPELSRLFATGAAGAVTAGVVHAVRNRIRRPLRDVEEGHEAIGKAVSAGETGFAALLSASAIFVPFFTLALLAGGAFAAVRVTRRVAPETRPCPRCGKPAPRLASICAGCGAAL